jgi:hypothetical protein
MRLSSKSPDKPISEVIARIRQLTIKARSNTRNRKKALLAARQAKNLLLRYNLRLEDIGSDAGDKHRVLILKEKSLSYLRSILTIAEQAEAEAERCRVAATEQRKEVAEIASYWAWLRSDLERRFDGMN